MTHLTRVSRITPERLKKMTALPAQLMQTFILEFKLKVI